jgi:hypothetical protein
MPPAILSRSRWSFSPGFSWGLCRWFLLAGVWLACCLCTDFFTGIFHEKKRRKISALFGLSFSGAVVFTDAASFPQAVRLLDDFRAGLRSATASRLNTACICRENFQRILRRGILCARSRACFLVY